MMWSEFDPMRLTDNSILNIHFTTGKIKTRTANTLSCRCKYYTCFQVLNVLIIHNSEMFLHSVHRAYYKNTKFFGQVDSILRVQSIIKLYISFETVTKIDSSFPQFNIQAKKHIFNTAKGSHAFLHRIFTTKYALLCER